MIMYPTSVKSLHTLIQDMLDGEKIYFDIYSNFNEIHSCGILGDPVFGEISIIYSYSKNRCFHSWTRIGNDKIGISIEKTIEIISKKGFCL